VFLLVPAHTGSPGQRALKWLLCVVVDEMQVTMFFLAYLLGQY